MNISIKEKLVRIAMREANKAVRKGNSPFGAVLSDMQGNVVDVAHNTTNTDSDPTAHAEINLIRNVARRIGSKDLSNYCLISNAQSCSMCFSAALKSKIRHFIFGADSEAHMYPNLTVIDIQKYVGDNVVVHSGILKDECKQQILESRKS